MCTGDGPQVDRLLADLARWSGDRAADEAAAARSRERWLRQQAAEDARFAGVLVDLAERALPVTVATTAGPVVRGRLAAVASDFVAVVPSGEGAGGRATLVQLGAVAWVRPEPGRRGGEAAAERAAPGQGTLAAALARLADDRPRVTVTTAGGAALTGELRSVGADVVTLRMDGRPPPTAYLPLAAVAVVTVL